MGEGLAMTDITNKRAAGSIHTNDLHIETTCANFHSDGTIHHDGKTIASQLAHLALAGCHVQRCRTGDFTVCKYGKTRYCKNFAKLQAFVRQLGVSE